MHFPKEKKRTRYPVVEKQWNYLPVVSFAKHLLVTTDWDVLINAKSEYSILTPGD